ncbi:MAG: hypothetical protein WC959_00250 [Kiritimatiellales bacterium]
MSCCGQIRVIGLLGVGFDHGDGQIRITQGEKFNIYLGSSETHQILRNICVKIKNCIEAEGKELRDYSPEEFMKLMSRLVD